MSDRLPLSRRVSPQAALGWLGTAVVVVVVYVVVVLGGGLLLDAPSAQLLLSVLATVVVAATIDGVQQRCERLAARLLQGGRQSPYDVLTRFSSRAVEADAVGRLPEQMARLLAEGTATAWAQVWLLVNGRPTLMATHPPDAAALTVPPSIGATTQRHDGLRSVAVGHAGRVLGMLRVQERKGRPLTGVEERLFVGLAAQAGLALHTAQLRAELEARHRELTARAEELRDARARLVAAQDRERQRLERDIHDGAQQQLVALQINLRLAQTLAARAPERAAALLGEQSAAAEDAIETLRTLSRGLQPRALREGGLGEALAVATSSSPLPVHLAVEVTSRFPRSVEGALYFFCLEALQNAVKHSGATRVEVRLEAHGETVELSVADDGSGITPGSSGGAGLRNMRDRLEAVGGTLRIESRPGLGTSATAVVPAVRVPVQRAV